ncbi:hypothetical protein X755_01230 [Mesorhizobium sp. LNJC405B00]|nr:hypothetical protein X755_01230 [Mesorhizobium sp. LNJC405B00]
MDFSEKRALAAAEVIPFPVDRHLVFIRQTARILERRQGIAAERFWKTECRRLYGRLQVQGLAEAEIRAEIERFAAAVHGEMRRAAWAEWQRRYPDGDAA